jgi:hypothetical protein
MSLGSRIADWYRGVQSFGVNRKTGIAVKFISSFLPHGRSMIATIVSHEGTIGSLSTKYRESGRSQKDRAVSMELEPDRLREITNMMTIEKYDGFDGKVIDGWRTYISGYWAGGYHRKQFIIGSGSQCPEIKAHLTSTFEYLVSLQEPAIDSATEMGAHP